MWPFFSKNASQRRRISAVSMVRPSRTGYAARRHPLPPAGTLGHREVLGAPRCPPSWCGAGAWAGGRQARTGPRRQAHVGGVVAEVHRPAHGVEVDVRDRPRPRRPSRRPSCRAPTTPAGRPRRRAPRRPSGRGSLVVRVERARSPASTAPPDGQPASERLEPPREPGRRGVRSGSGPRAGRSRRAGHRRRAPSGRVPLPRPRRRGGLGRRGRPRRRARRDRRRTG